MRCTTLYPLTKHSHNTRNFMPCSFRIVCGFFDVPHWTYKHRRYCETGPTVYSPYPRRLESLTICWCNYKGDTFYSVILRPQVLVRPESNSRPPAWQSDSHLTEQRVLWATELLMVSCLRASLLKVRNFSIFPAGSKRAFCLLFNLCKFWEK